MKNPFLLVTIGVCSVLLIPALFMDGMFMDGMLYSSVSKNYALGIGTFWEPVFSSTMHSSFHEQPPLMFFLQGLFFKMLGFSFYTERIYSLIAAIINAILIYRCWKIISPEENTGWVPVIFWFTMPVTFYAFINNLEECTMSIFVLAGMIHLLRAFHLKEKETLHLIFAGAWILLAGLTKGLQGMFLLAAPFLWFITVRNSGFLQMIRQTIFILIVPILFVLYAWVTPAAHDSFQSYFINRVFTSFSHVRDTSGSRFHLLFELLLDVLIVLSSMVFILLISKKKTPLFEGWSQHKKLILFFALVAASGILPLMVTLEQRGFYLVTALPYVAFVAALFVAPQMKYLMEKFPSKKRLSNLIGSFGIILILGAIVSSIFLAGKPKRDAEKLHDLPLIAAQTGENKTILTSDEICRNWSFGMYAMRNHGLSITENSGIANQWLILEKDDSPPAGYQLITLSTTHYNLFRKQP